MARFHLLVLAAALAGASPPCDALSLPGSTSAGHGLTRPRFLCSAASAVLLADLSCLGLASGAAAPPPACAADDPPRYREAEVPLPYGEDAAGRPLTRATLVRRYTGDGTPYAFPAPRPLPLARAWPAVPPFGPADFFRADEGDDENFYTVPRLVYHIDEPAVAALTQYYRASIRPGSTILDICGSWVSHYPLEFKKNMRRISGTGMNASELRANDQLTDYVAKNLNVDPTLPYEDNTFDVVTCVVSIDYLIKPIEVMKEVRRVLKPGGMAIISQSNRCFPSKAIAMWLKMDDREHLELINGYAKYAGFGPGKAFDITASVPDDPNNNPMFIVEVTK